MGSLNLLMKYMEMKVQFWEIRMSKVQLANKLQHCNVLELK